MKLQQLYTVGQVESTFGVRRREVLEAIWGGELAVAACGAQGWEVTPGALASWVAQGPILRENSCH